MRGGGRWEDIWGMLDDWCRVKLVTKFQLVGSPSCYRLIECP